MDTLVQDDDALGIWIEGSRLVARRGEKCNVGHQGHRIDEADTRSNLDPVPRDRSVMTLVAGPPDRLAAMPGHLPDCGQDLGRQVGKFKA